MDITFTVVLLIVMLFNVLLLIIKHFWLSVIVGFVTFAIVAVALTTSTIEIAFSPYLEVMVFFVVVVCLYYAVQGSRD